MAIKIEFVSLDRAEYTVNLFTDFHILPIFFASYATARHYPQ